MPPDSFPLFAAPSCLGQQGFPPWGISCTLQTFSQSTCLWNQAAFPSFSWVKGFPTLILAHSLITHCFPVGSLPEDSSSHWLTSAVGTTSLPGPARFLSPLCLPHPVLGAVQLRRRLPSQGWPPAAGLTPQFSFWLELQTFPLLWSLYLPVPELIALPKFSASWSWPRAPVIFCGRACFPPSESILHP